ncbi:MAG: hypothetical protein C0434_01215 [Xanthomonadaceae bacterium]|nr:hypothetical protein [Xanthomonadaceae bacterium]
MARDYAKPRNPNAGRNHGRAGNGPGGPRRGDNSGGSGGALPGWVWLIVGLAIGLVVAAFVYIDRPQHKTRLGEAAQADDGAKPPIKGSTDKPAKPAAGDIGGKTAKPDSVPVPSPDKVPPRYTFYNELPKIEVAIPREYSRPAPAPAPGKPAPAPAKPPPAEVKQALADPGGAYLVQVGAYKSREEADRQRAKLALIGYESRIEQVTLGERDVRFRVRVGPQPNLSAAQDVLARLESNSVSGFLVKIKD